MTDKNPNYNEKGTYGIIDSKENIVEYCGKKQLFRSKVLAEKTRKKLLNLNYREIFVKKLKKSRNDLQLTNP